MASPETGRTCFPLSAHRRSLEEATRGVGCLAYLSPWIFFPPFVTRESAEANPKTERRRPTRCQGLPTTISPRLFRDSFVGRHEGVVGRGADEFGVADTVSRTKASALIRLLAAAFPSSRLRKGAGALAPSAIRFHGRFDNCNQASHRRRRWKPICLHPVVAWIQLTSGDIDPQPA